MAVRAPFGQYVQADSVVHRLDARAKLGATAAAAVALFSAERWIGLVAVALIFVLALALSRVSVRLILRGIRPLLWLLAFTFIANSAWPPVRTETLFSIGPIAFDAGGVQTGAFFVVRLLLLITSTSLITLTTSPVALTDAFSQLLSPLALVRFPVEDAAMMMSIALRFMPTTAEEAERIVVAQTARGARFDEGGLVRRIRAWLPVLVPLFVRLFRRADDLAVAMEARCYRGRGRTRLREAKMRPGDWAVLITSVVACVSIAIFL